MTTVDWQPENQQTASVPQPLKFQIIHPPCGSGLSTRCPGIKIQFAMKKKIFLLYLQVAWITIRQPLRMLLFAHRKEKKLKEQLSHQVN